MWSHRRKEEEEGEGSLVAGCSQGFSEEEALQSAFDVEVGGHQTSLREVVGEPGRGHGRLEM